MEGLPLQSGTGHTGFLPDQAEVGGGEAGGAWPSALVWCGSINRNLFGSRKLPDSYSASVCLLRVERRGHTPSIASDIREFRKTKIESMDGVIMGGKTIGLFQAVAKQPVYRHIASFPL